MRTRTTTQTRHGVLRWLAVLAVLLLLATACSSDDSGDDTAETSDDSAFGEDEGDDADEPAFDEEPEQEEEARDDEMAEEEPADEGDFEDAQSAPSAAAADAAEGTQVVIVPEPEPLPIDTEDPRVNGFVVTSRDPQSTFALDVDTGSYTLARAALNNGSVPRADQVRVEEFINALDQGYVPPVGTPFAITADGATWPFSQLPDNRLVRIGLATPEQAGERLPSNLVFVIDTSGSMAGADKLGLVQDSLRLLLANLQPGDTVSIVAYNDTARLVLPQTPWDEEADVLNAIARLQAGGSTNLAAGLDLGYALAREDLREEGINRVILLSDGIANTGDTEVDRILERIGTDRARGIEMVTVGVGQSGFNDALMERLADEGDGFYAFVDSLDEAQRVFGRDLTSTLQTIAEEARIQVEFNPDVVSSYRLLGFENRAVADEEFRNDFRDAGEIGAGHQVTALYEVDLTGDVGRLATVRLRWIDPARDIPQEIAQDISSQVITDGFVTASPVLQLNGVVAAWAELLRSSGFAVASPSELLDEAVRLEGVIGTPQATEIRELIGRYAALS